MSVRDLTSEIRWVSQCHDMGDHHEHISLYLLSRGDTHVLVDSGAQTARETVQSTLDGILGDETVDAVVLTHADLPHSGNVPMLREIYPDIDVYSSSGLPGVVGLSDDVEKCDRGETMTISGREMSFIDPPLQDIGHSTWIYDESEAVLFTADGIGNTHASGDCQKLSTEFEAGIPSSRIESFHRHKLRWLVYVEPDEIMRDVRELVGEWAPSYVAPIHGNPIARDSIDSYLDRLGRSLERIANEQREETP